MKGLLGFDRHVMVLTGACLSSRVERTDRNCCASEEAVSAGFVYSEEESMLLEKFGILMDDIFLKVLIILEALCLRETGSSQKNRTMIG